MLRKNVAYVPVTTRRGVGSTLGMQTRLRAGLSLPPLLAPASPHLCFLPDKLRRTALSHLSCIMTCERRGSPVGTVLSWAGSPLPFLHPACAGVALALTHPESLDGHLSEQANWASTLRVP